jgi:RimJ/RimL family protein N-acetyltransferase
MAHFPALLDAGQSAALVQRIERRFRERGYGLFAVEARAQGRLIGFVGLSPVGRSLPFAPAVEIGWRLARPCWGRGLAHEAAEAVLAFAFVQARLPALVSFTTQGNARSRRLMERLGMRRDPAEDFIHPELRGHRLAPHVLYRLRAAEWRLRG